MVISRGIKRHQTDKQQGYKPDRVNVVQGASVLGLCLRRSRWEPGLSGVHPGRRGGKAASKRQEQSETGQGKADRLGSQGRNMI